MKIINLILLNLSFLIVNSTITGDNSLQVPKMEYHPLPSILPTAPKPYDGQQIEFSMPTSLSKSTTLKHWLAKVWECPGLEQTTKLDAGILAYNPKAVKSCPALAECAKRLGTVDSCMARRTAQYNGNLKPSFVHRLFIGTGCYALGLSNDDIKRCHTESSYRRQCFYQACLEEQTAKS